MTKPTLALVIGVSRYRDTSIPLLPAGEKDALRFANSLKKWNISEENITLLLNEEAICDRVEEYFDSLLKKTEPFQFVFYFCGHGFRTLLPKPTSFLTFFDSSLGEANKADFTLDLLNQKISDLCSTSSYAFIDACHLRMNALSNPKLKEELGGKIFSEKSFFCLLSSGIQKSFEDAKGEYGYFTEALIQSLSKIRFTGCSPTDLLESIKSIMKQKELPFPEMYNIGTEKISFLPLEKSFSAEVRKAVHAVLSCGICINEHLFSKVFEIEKTTFLLLEKLELISRFEDYWMPNDLLYEIAQFEQMFIDKDRVFNYWSGQMEETPNHVAGAKSFILAVKCLGYEKRIDPHLKASFHALSLEGGENLSYLKDGVDIFLASSICTESSLFLTQVLTDQGQLELTKALSKLKNQDRGGGLKAKLLTNRSWIVKLGLVCSVFAFMLLALSQRKSFSAPLDRLDIVELMGRNYIGPSVWSKLLNVKVDFVPLPEDIKDILNSPCPFDPHGKATVGQTHILVLLPKRVDGVLLSIKNLKQTMSRNLDKEDLSIQFSGPGVDSPFSNGESFFNLSLGNTEWVLMYRGGKGIIPNSRNKTLEEQKELIPAGYRMMSLTELSIATLAYYRQTGEKLFVETEDIVDGELKYKLPTWTLCADSYSGEYGIRERVPTFGGWTAGGLQINKSGGPEDRFKNNGISVCLELVAKQL